MWFRPYFFSLCFTFNKLGFWVKWEALVAVTCLLLIYDKPTSAENCTLCELRLKSTCYFFLKLQSLILSTILCVHTPNYVVHFYCRSIYFFPRSARALSMTHDPLGTANARDQINDLSLWESSSGTLQGRNWRQVRNFQTNTQYHMVVPVGTLSTILKGTEMDLSPPTLHALWSSYFSLVFAGCCFWLLETNFLKSCLLFHNWHSMM